MHYPITDSVFNNIQYQNNLYDNDFHTQFASVFVNNAVKEESELIEVVFQVFLEFAREQDDDRTGAQDKTEDDEIQNGEAHVSV